MVGAVFDAEAVHGEALALRVALVRTVDYEKEMSFFPTDKRLTSLAGFAGEAGRTEAFPL